MAKFDRARWHKLEKHLEVFMKTVELTSTEITRIVDEVPMAKATRVALTSMADRLDAVVTGLAVELRSGAPAMSLLRSWLSPARWVGVAVVGGIAAGSFQDLGARLNHQVGEMVEQLGDIDTQIEVIEPDTTSDSGTYGSGTYGGGTWNSGQWGSSAWGSSAWQSAVDAAEELESDD